MSNRDVHTWCDLFESAPDVPHESLKWWLSERLDTSLTTLPLHETPSELDREAFWHAITRLQTGEPIQYICGRAPFRNLTLEITPDVLIPRPETEQLVQFALDAGIPDTSRVLDVGTGSGCIALSLKQERNDLQVEGVDLSLAALEVARKNAERLHLEVHFRKADLLQEESDLHWDVIISNPPYIGETERDALPHMVREFEPAEALFSGPRGLNHIERLLAEAPRVLKPDGFLLLETGETQTDEIRKYAERHGLTHHCKTDLAGRDRFHLFRNVYP